MIAVPPRTTGRTKAPQDTVVGCRSRAEADLLASIAMPIANERIRLETSAASWTARADLLQRLDDSSATRLAHAARAVSESEAAQAGV